jgi:5-methylcytosine-specific restriction endonuclease McrA
MAAAVMVPQRSSERRRNFAKQVAKRWNLLEILAMRQNSLCFWCGDLMVTRAFTGRDGKQIDDPHKATLDHVVSLASGGATDDKNCVAACQACNQLRGKFNTKVWQGEMQSAHEKRRAAEGRAAHYKRRCMDLEQWMNQQQERLRVSEDRAEMHAATIDMTTEPESVWTKLCRWFGGN